MQAIHSAAEESRKKLKPKRAAAYVRVSSFDQNTEAQETALQEYIQRRGWTVHTIYRDEGISGTKASRPALDELLRDCRRKAIDVVVVWKFDRFARSLTTLVSGLERCRALGMDFVSVTEAVDTSLPMGELMFQIVGAISQFERSLIAERVRSGLANARAKGKGPGPTAPEEVIGQRDHCTGSRTRPGQTNIQNAGHEVRGFGLDGSLALRGPS